jgi:long-chain acyl-CoA synthetase
LAICNFPGYSFFFGLRKARVIPGDRMTILSESRVGWAIAKLGIQAAGAVTVSIYATNTSEQIEYVLNHADAKIFFVSSCLQYEKLIKIRGQIPGVELAVSCEQFLGEKELPFTPSSNFRKLPTP